MTVLTVHRPGPLSTVQDLGRPGQAHLGVPPSGALDVPAYELANRLTGNAHGVAALETTLGGLCVSADRAVVVAVTGAPAPLRIDGRPAALHCPLALAPGQQLTLGVPAVGVRSYLAVRGGITVTPVFGSRSTDILSGLGPEPLRCGDTLPVGRPQAPVPWISEAAAGSYPATIWLQVFPGPRADWFADGTFASLRTATYRVSEKSNRVAVRLQGPELHRFNRRELLSEGLVIGAVEVPPDGQPLIFLADHPTTGGYPAVAVVDPAGLPQLAQARPGAPVRFLPCTLPGLLAVAAV
jgi:biotin-dependent carboxylase-like uncharacterized protein